MGIPPQALTSETVEWATPQEIFDRYDKRFHFTLDPCATAKNAKCQRFFTRDDDGLSQDWGEESVYMNPPYGSSIAQWLQKAYEASLKGALVVCLIPANTDVGWWHDWAVKGDVKFLRGRIRFITPSGKPAGQPTFGSAIVIYWPAELGFLAG